ncbi:MAG: magnesium-translocating P-type ATPase [Nitrospiraceae bacterium]|nr:magnesium-translocating P-type ATPase [Nitrospiraceae bacterium]
MDGGDPAFWAREPGALFQQLQTGPQGLSHSEAEARRRASATTALKPAASASDLSLLFRQFNSPIILILLAAACVAWFLEDRTDTAIILSIVLVSGLLGFWQERGASRSVERLLAMVQVKSDVLRDGRQTAVPVQDIVPGDIVFLRAGDTVPGDSLLLESKSLFLDEAALTGETYPVEKFPGVLTTEQPLAKRTNSLFLGTHVVSGTGTAVVAAIGTDTEFGRISQHLKLRPPETEFERGVRRFGYLLMEVTLGLVAAIFAINMFFARPVLESFLFSLALAVGLTPQLLPAIISINLAQGARRMARQKVIVKRLAAIENFGSMTVFCSDKTGTLTLGQVRLQDAVDLEGRTSEAVLFHAYLNASFEGSFLNPIDEAIRSHRRFDVAGYRKLDEEPYDFVRKRLSILVATPDGHLMVTKGAWHNVLDVCDRAEAASGAVMLTEAMRLSIERQVRRHSEGGLRVLAVARRQFESQARLTAADEAGMTFMGLLLFTDPPKPGIAATVAELRELGVALKILTGDNAHVAAHVAQEIGLPALRMLTGAELRRMSDEALVSRVTEVELFTEVEPNQKERIILALKKAGHVVGYGGDGINDASALHAADVGVSVEGAVDVAKEAADIVLLEKNLGILAQGIREGRTTFANTLKYVFMATSANFGNMFSMAGASTFLPFLPLLPKQILLTNLLTDIPEMTIATDRVDRELIDRPRRWDIAFIRKFMMTFGLISSCFDFLTFGVLLWGLNAGVEEFRTGWFVESVVSASVIVLVIRSRRPLVRSRPSRPLLLSTALVAAVTILLPLTPLRGMMGLTPLPPVFWGALAIIVLLYACAAELAKRAFYRSIRL